MAEKVFTADLHTHLLEKKVRPRDFWANVIARKIDVVAITEHAEFNPEKAFEALLETKPKNVLLIPGIEMNSSIGHVLVFAPDEKVFGFPELLEKRVKIEKIVSIAKKNGFLVSIAHPWGFSYDSAAFIAGEKRLEKIVLENRIGVEAFNGMVGQVGNFVYNTNWVKRPLNFFEKLENNKVAKKIRLSKIGAKARKKIDEKSREVIERTAKPIILGNKAAFMTAGSDAHYATRIGAGIMKMRLEEGIGNEDFLGALSKKTGIEWIGPLTKERNGIMEFAKLPKKRIEALQALKYATKTWIMKKTRLKERLFGKKVARKK
ncbi:MAG: hypothetical protein PHD95_05455 [Candidatus ainarchaeum sp.]|nr:hypothetical protein [Candidatus ainarchaeum sp.]